jgi:hypothetical protein
VSAGSSRKSHFIAGTLSMFSLVLMIFDIRLMDSLVRVEVMTRPPTLKALSDDAEVAGIANMALKVKFNF